MFYFILMYSNKEFVMDKRENLTKLYIYKALMKLLTKKPYEKITVCEITKTAGVSRMSFYRNFESKEDLIFNGIKEIVLSVNNKIKQHEVVNIYTITKEFFETFKNFKDIITSFDNSPITKELLDVIVKRMKENIPIDYMNKTSKYIPIFYFGAISTTMIEWLKSGAVETPDEMARMISSLISIDIPKSNEFHEDDDI